MHCIQYMSTRQLSQYKSAMLTCTVGFQHKDPCIQRNYSDKALTHIITSTHMDTYRYGKAFYNILFFKSSDPVFLSSFTVNFVLCKIVVSPQGRKWNALVQNSSIVLKTKWQNNRKTGSVCKMTEVMNQAMNIKYMNRRSSFKRNIYNTQHERHCMMPAQETAAF